MSGWMAAFFTYLATTIIAFMCAGMIFLMVAVLEKFPPKKSDSR